MGKYFWKNLFDLSLEEKYRLVDLIFEDYPISIKHDSIRFDHENFIVIGNIDDEYHLSISFFGGTSNSILVSLNSYNLCLNLIRICNTNPPYSYFMSDDNKFRDFIYYDSDID